MKTKVYVAAPLHEREAAAALANCLREAGVIVTSTWHDGHPTPEIEATLSVSESRLLADACAEEVLSSHALILLYGDVTTRHGSVFEAGLAYGGALDVYVVSIRPGSVLPTVLLLGKYVSHCSIDEVIEILHA